MEEVTWKGVWHAGGLSWEGKEWCGGDPSGWEKGMELRDGRKTGHKEGLGVCMFIFKNQNF